MTRARTTDDTYTHIVRLTGGYVLTFRADHGVVYCDVAHDRSRHPSTNRMPIEQARTLHRRLGDLLTIAPSTGGPRA